MKIRIALFFASLLTAFFFIYFSYSVAKERWQKIDFNTTVKLQDHIPRRFDKYFSLFSLIGSVEITVGVALLFAFFSLLRGHILPFLAWLLIFPASLAEVIAKLVLYHPAPPYFLHRTTIPADLPSFYIHTDYSYPSGHMTRTAFLLTVLLFLVVFSSKRHGFKILAGGLLLGFAFLMGITRVYLGEHWLSDVLGGVLLGMAGGFLASVWVLPASAAAGLRKPAIA